MYPIIPTRQPATLTRRRFLQLGTAGLTAATAGNVRGASTRRPPLTELVGINVSSFTRQTRATESGQRIDPYDVPRVMRDEVGVRVIDLVSPLLGTRDPQALSRFRREAERADCVITNLKVNDHNLPFDGEDAAARQYALDEYKQWIEAAAALGARWLRPFPALKKPRWERLVAGYAELADHAARHDITLLVENYRWLETEPEAIPRLVAALDGRIKAQPDTLNWKDHATRLRGLTLAFPHAASADFKVREIGPAGEHPLYDLRACFEIGRKAGFRGPWCIEHVNADKAALLRELRFIAEQLRRWDTGRD